MYDRCVAGDKLRTVMSSIMRRRRGLISAIGGLLSQGLGFDNRNPHRQDPFPLTTHSTPAIAGSFNPTSISTQNPIRLYSDGPLARLRSSRYAASTRRAYFRGACRAG